MRLWDNAGPGGGRRRSSSSPRCSPRRSRRRLKAVILVGRHRLRHRDAVPAARRPGPGADPGPGRDGHPGRVRAGAAQAARVLHRPAAARHAAGGGWRSARWSRRGRRGAWSCLPRVPGSPRRCRRTSPRRPYTFGGGKNIVNVTLVDIRAWDTLGEISVLVVAATGVASLIFLRRRYTGSSHRRASAVPTRLRRRRAEHGDGARRSWLAAGADRCPRAALDHLRGGHPAAVPHRSWCSRCSCCSPGTTPPAAGSPAGWSPGLALMSATWPAAGYELDEAAPVDAGRCSGPGCSIAAGSACWRRWPSAAQVAAERRSSTCDAARCSARSTWSPRCSSTSASTWSWSA